MHNFFTQWHRLFLDTDRVPELIMVIVICAVAGMITGPLMGNANPLFWNVLGGVFGGLGDKLDRKKRHYADLMSRGLILTTIILAACGGISWCFREAINFYPYYEVLRTLFLASLVTVGSVWFVLLQLYFSLSKGITDKKSPPSEAATYALSKTAGISLNTNDEFALTRAAMVLSVRRFDKGLVAPCLWYLIGGFPAACIYAGLAMMSWRFGKNGLGSGFAAVPLALERLVGFIPSLLSGFFITMAAGITPTAKLHKGVASWMGHKNRAPYDQGGFPVSALAWALNVSIGGPVKDNKGYALKGAWVGPEGATAKLNHKHLRRAIYINVIAHFIFIAALLGMYMWDGIL
ncbi:MAG: cobalamin biosynthesis protein [Alphaproteobacteria bacterium]|nr:cobalamin biosynthesis protein [Alphaproteobacteria bacterium]